MTDLAAAFEASLRAKRPEGYDDLVRRVVTAVRAGTGDTWDAPSPDLVTFISSGDYQGTHVLGVRLVRGAGTAVVVRGAGADLGCNRRADRRMVARCGEALRSAEGGAVSPYLHWLSALRRLVEWERTEKGKRALSTRRLTTGSGAA